MRLASILNQTNLSDDPVTTETGLYESQGQSSYSDVHSKRSFKTCSNIEFDYSKIYLDGRIIYWEWYKNEKMER